MPLEVRNIVKSYDNAPLLQGVSFDVANGEIVCLLGRSGSGKSTLLRIIAGLEPAERGNILWNGMDVSTMPVHQRGFGLMFQDYALFPHRNVEQNVAFGLRMQNLPEETIKARTAEMLTLVHLPDFTRRSVGELSGGEQQRIALARALAPRPGLLMLDEPLGALDRTLKQSLLGDLRQIMREAHIPVIYVTHDQEEAFSIADRLIMLNAGKIEQIGSPEAIYRHPANLWVARFLGLDNIIPARIDAKHTNRVSTSVGKFLFPASTNIQKNEGEVSLLFLPDVPGMIISRDDSVRLNSDTHVRLTGNITESVFLEGKYRLAVRIGGYSLHFLSITGFNCGTTVHIDYPLGEIQWLKNNPTTFS